MHPKMAVAGHLTQSSHSLMIQTGTLTETKRKAPPPSPANKQYPTQYP
jgi:hypothetical protein